VLFKVQFAQLNSNTIVWWVLLIIHSTNLLQNTRDFYPCPLKNWILFGSLSPVRILNWSSDISAGVPHGGVLGPKHFQLLHQSPSFHCKSHKREFCWWLHSAWLCFQLLSLWISLCNMQQEPHNIRVWDDRWQIIFIPHRCQTMTIANKRDSNHQIPLTRNLTVPAK